LAETLKRIDPPSRAVDGDSNTVIVGKDPNREYKFANPNDEMCGVSALAELGFEIERARKDGPRIKGGKVAKDGDTITWRGMVLMSCPRDVWMAEYKRGQDRQAAIDQTILRPGGLDGVRGPTGRLAQNLTTQEVEFSRT